MITATLVNGYQLPKLGNTDTECEDSFAVSNDGLAAAVSDGASSSIYAGEWASSLAQSFVLEPTMRVTPTWVKRQASLFNSKIDTAKIPWHALAKFCRGIHASLAGIAIDPNISSFSILSVGDSCVAWTVDGEHAGIFPQKRASEFTRTPFLLSTHTDQNVYLHRHRRVALHVPIVGKTMRIYLMTDAIAKWYLTEVEAGSKPWVELSNIGGRSDFAQLIDRLRRNERIENDDVTVLVIELRSQA